MAHLFRLPEGDWHVARREQKRGEPWCEPWSRSSLRHLALWVLQAGRVPTRTHDEAKAYVGGRACG